MLEEALEEAEAAVLRERRQRANFYTTSADEVAPFDIVLQSAAVDVHDMEDDHAGEWAPDAAALDAATCSSRCRPFALSTNFVEGVEDIASESPKGPTALAVFVAAYSRCVARAPCLCATLGLLLGCALAAVGMLLLPPTFETDTEAFLKVDADVSTKRDIFLKALESRSSGSRRLNSLYSTFQVEVVYELDETSGHRGIFVQHLMTQVLDFEHSLVNLPEWRSLCAESYDMARALCDPGLSMAGYFQPSLVYNASEVVPSELLYDGRGSEVLPPETVFQMIQGYGLTELLLPRGDTAPGKSSRMIRSVFRFKISSCTTFDPTSVCAESVMASTERWKRFVSDVALPHFRKAVEEDDFDGLRMYYSGTYFKEAEIMYTLVSDITLSSGAVIFVLLYLLFHTRSFLLSSIGLLLIGLAVPLSYVAFATTTGTTTMSIASCLSLFLVVGLGSDVVLVYADFWNASSHECEKDSDRLTWTILHGGKASFATTAMTAVSFFANLASVLKPLREFGFFMGLCVALVWVLISAILVPLCLVSERHFKQSVGCWHRGPKWWLAFWSRSSEQRGGCRDRAVEAWMRALHRCRRAVLVFAALVSIGALFSAVALVKVDTGVPNIFPRSHNQNIGSDKMALFMPVADALPLGFDSPPQKAKVGNPFDIISPASNYPLYWCEAPSAASSSALLPQRAPAGQCLCYALPTPCARVDVSAGPTADIAVVRFAGLPELGSEVVKAKASELLVATYGGNVSDWKLDPPTRLPPLLTTEWDTGTVELRDVTEVRAILSPIDGGSPRLKVKVCSAELCFCEEALRCKLPGSSTWLGDVSLLALPPPSTSPGGLRRLSAASASEPTLPGWRSAVWPALGGLPPARRLVASNARANIDVVFGLDVLPSSPLLGTVDLDSLWSFDPDYEPRQPWAQRSMHNFCESLSKDMLVTEKSCWIDSFKTFLDRRGERWPAPEHVFDSLVVEFSSTTLTGKYSSRDYMWIRDTSVKASYMVFQVDVAQYEAADVALEYKLRWDHHLSAYRSDASRFASNAWHTSSLWARAEAQRQLILSTLVTLALVIGLAFLGMLAFTRDCILAVLVSLSTISVICCLAFFMVVVAAWPIGPIEVLGLIVFVGYAVTYSLHVAHRYGSRDFGAADTTPLGLGGAAAIRYRRTEFALKSMGGGALGSAVTTAGCAAFLLVCTLTIFQRLGSVVLMVTLLSIGAALVPLPAALLCLGPRNPSSCCCKKPTASDATLPRLLTSNFNDALSLVPSVESHRASCSGSQNESPPASSPPKAFWVTVGDGRCKL